MQSGQPSLTALRVAAQRAAHQLVDGGLIFEDPYAIALAGSHLEEAVHRAAANAPERLMLAARSRFAEDCLADAVARGTKQIVILGAGLDSFGIRNPFGFANVRLFEVDHPATQKWKRERMEAAGLETSAVRFVPVDFERDALKTALIKAGFDFREHAYFHWLGVVMYLAPDTVWSTMEVVGECAAAELVFDYSEPLANYPDEQRAYVEKAAAEVAAQGERWVTWFDPVELHAKLGDLGFAILEDRRLDLLVGHYLGQGSKEIPSGAGPHIIRIKTKGRRM